MSGAEVDRPQPVVLAADDDEDILELVAFRLERSGYTVLKARDGEEALQVARERAARPRRARRDDAQARRLRGHAAPPGGRRDEAMPIIL